MDHKSNGDSFGSRLPTSGAERYSGPYTPYGRAEPCAAPISAQEVQALLSELAMLAPLQGAWTISADGLPVAILHAHSEAHFRLLRENIAEVLAWGWNGVFGTMVSFTLAGKDPQSEAFSRMLVAQDNPFVSRFKESGRAAFAAGWRGNVGKFFMTDFGNHPTCGNSPLIGFRNLAEFVEPKEFFFRDDELSYWQLMGMPTMHWAKGLSHAEIARAAWARDFEGDLHAFWKGLDETRTLLRDGSREEVAPVITGGRAVYPGLLDLAAVIADEKKSFADTFFWMETLVVDEMRLSDVLYGLLDGKTEVDEHVRQFIAFGLACALHGPRVTAYGTRKPWLSARNPKHTVQTLFTPVDLRKVGSKEGLNAETYWPISGVFEAFDVGACISGSDIPMNRSRLAAELGPHVLDSSVDEAHRIIASVLIEAGEHRKWSAPWGARVQISFGPLKWMDVFELEGEFIVLFRDTQEHYLACSMNVVNSTFACHGIFEGEEPAEREDIEAALLLIAASAVRDFLGFLDRPPSSRVSQILQGCSLA